MRRFSNYLAVAVLIAVSGAEARADDALELAKKLTTEGAKAFSSKNATAMAAFYIDDAQVEIISRNASTGGLNRDIRSGKFEIKKLYEEAFKTDGAVDARNLVEHARFLGKDLLMICGSFEISAGGNTSTFPFIQIRTKQGDKWLLTSVQVFVTPGS